MAAAIWMAVECATSFAIPTPRCGFSDPRTLGVSPGVSRGVTGTRTGRVSWGLSRGVTGPRTRWVAPPRTRKVVSSCDHGAGVTGGVSPGVSRGVTDPRTR